MLEKKDEAGVLQQEDTTLSTEPETQEIAKEVATEAQVENPENLVALETPSRKKKKEKKVKEKKPKSKKSKKKKIIIGIIILALIGVGAVKLLTPKEVQGFPVTTGTAEKMNVEQVVSIKGTVEGSETAKISSAVSYEVSTINVAVGDKVSKGQILATLDADSIQAEYSKNQKQLEQSKFQYDAAQSLFAEGAISQEDLLKAKTTYENDSITVSSFRGLEQTQIKSPINGTVTRVNTSLGRAANDTENKEAMFVIEDLDKLQMKVKISEYDISKIALGQSVVITAEVMGEESVSGVVSKISPTGEKKDDSSKEMVVPVTIDVTKGNDKLIAGVSATAKILIEKKENVLTVPIDAILENSDTGKSDVMVVHGTKVKKVPVELGTEGNFEIEITSGKLKAGDLVVLSPTPDITDGMEVTPMPQN